MRSEHLAMRFGQILSEADLSRITIIESEDSVSVKVDVHGLTRRRAEQLINNIICLGFYESFTLAIIHGYHHGVAIKTMLENYTHCRVIQKLFDSTNPGVTYLSIA